MLKVAQQHDSITLEADARHLLTDVWTSVGVVGGLLVVMAMPQWAILDPLMAVAVAIHILFTGFNLLRRSADGLMDTALPPEEVARAEALIAAELPASISQREAALPGLIELLRQAEAVYAQEGWTAQTDAIAFIKTVAPNETPRKHTFGSWRHVLRDAGVFDVRRAPVSPDGPIGV